jgi:hypothetical protein
MSDDRPAIAALLDALDKYDIAREEVSPLNLIKLDLLHPDDWVPFDWSYLLGGDLESTGAAGNHRVSDEGCSGNDAEVHEEADEESGAARRQAP